MRNRIRIHHDGVTLVEALVGLLLIGICVTGIVSVYAQHDKSIRGGKLHARAAQLGATMATLIREAHEPTANFETGLGNACDVAELPTVIENVVACWQDQVGKELANGSARIVLDHSSVPPHYVIIISWAEPRTGTASYVLRVPLNAVMQSAPLVSSATESPAANHAAN